MGFGSGGHNKLSEAEKLRRNGKVKASRTDEAYAQRAAEKIVVGPWLSDIPDPEYPLNEIGRKKYFELARAMFEQRKLTLTTKMLAEQVAVLHQQIFQRLSEGQQVPTNMSEKIQRVILQLGIAENGPTIASPPEKATKFTYSGFANRRPQKV
jgi:hypothetical protein